MPALGLSIGKAAFYTVKGSGSGLAVVRELMIVLLGMEAGAAGDGKDAYWMCLEAVKTDGKTLTAYVLVDDPVLTPERTGRTRVLRYIYQEGQEEPVEYINAAGGGAVTTVFGLMQNFFPSFDAQDVAAGEVFPQQGYYLGLPIERTLVRELDRELPSEPRRLELDPDLLIGTGRNTRDVIGRRDWSGDDYEYRPFKREEYEEMIDAGINYFLVNAEQEPYVRWRPVFYLKWVGQNLEYPEMFYRANCRGITQFMDEPAIHLGWFFEKQPDVAKAMLVPAEAARLLDRRVKQDYFGGQYARWRLHRSLAGSCDLGHLVIDENHYPAWETQEWSVYYQLAAGLPGAVHEGRYTNQADVNIINADYGSRIPDTAENNMKIRFAWFRGAARAFGGDWGTAIYGQCERSISPIALATAYDMGARYLWYWTSDRLHHMPYPEQLELTRQLRAHARQHPRPSLDRLRRAAHTAIVLPDGYPMGQFCMWGSMVFHLDRVNRYGLTYREVLSPVSLQIERCIREDISFDLIYSYGPEVWRSYNEAVVVGEDGSVRFFRKGAPAGEAPLPDRSDDTNVLAPPAIKLRVEPVEGEPLKVKLTAEIDNGGRPVGLRTRDWGTPGWTRLEAFWFVFEDPAAPRFVPGPRVTEHTFAQAGTYTVRVWTCNEQGLAAREIAAVTVPLN